MGASKESYIIQPINMCCNGVKYTLDNAHSISFDGVLAYSGNILYDITVDNINELTVYTKTTPAMTTMAYCVLLERLMMYISFYDENYIEIDRVSKEIQGRNMSLIMFDSYAHKYNNPISIVKHKHIVKFCEMFNSKEYFIKCLLKMYNEYTSGELNSIYNSIKHSTRLNVLLNGNDDNDVVYMLRKYDINNTQKDMKFYKMKYDELIYRTNIVCQVLHLIYNIGDTFTLNEHILGDFITEVKVNEKV